MDIWCLHFGCCLLVEKPLLLLACLLISQLNQYQCNVRKKKGQKEKKKKGKGSALVFPLGMSHFGSLILEFQPYCILAMVISIKACCSAYALQQLDQYANYYTISFTFGASVRDNSVA